VALVRGHPQAHHQIRELEVTDPLAETRHLLVERILKIAMGGRW